MRNETPAKSRMPRQKEIEVDPLFVAPVNKMLLTPPKTHDGMKSATG